MRNELERLQTCTANLQKTNLCLEAENMELKMDLEKYSKETPHLHEQIRHLERLASDHILSHTPNKKMPIIALRIYSFLLTAVTST